MSLYKRSYPYNTFNTFNSRSI